jgi:hypothetical protein
VYSIQAMVNAINTELGVNPQGVYADVATRLDILEARIGELVAEINTLEAEFAALSAELTALQVTVAGIAAEIVTINAEITSIQTELGTDPQGAYNSVAIRLNAMQTAINSLASGDGYINALFLQGYLISPQAPTDGYVLAWNGANWIPTHLSALSGSFTASQDLSGNSTAQTVVGLYNHPLASTAPVLSAVPVWDGSIYDIRKLTVDDLGPAFTITGFSGGSVVELGVTVTNPAFSASYSSTPNSASITNSASIDSPLVLNPPYTSGTVVGSFADGGSSVTVITFTLTAIAATTQQAFQYIYFEIRDYGGVGTAGATSSVTSSMSPATPTVTLSTSDVLASEGLFYGGENAGTIFGPFSPSGQKIYLLLQGSSHTFKDANTGFAFPFNAPTTVSFTNQYGVAGITMYLYESQFNLSATYSIEVVS